MPRKIAALLLALLLALSVVKQAGSRNVVAVEKPDIAIFALEGRAQTQKMLPTAVDVILLALDEDLSLAVIIQLQCSRADTAPAAATVVGFLEPVILLQLPERKETVGMILMQRTAPCRADVFHDCHALQSCFLRST